MKRRFIWTQWEYTRHLNALWGIDLAKSECMMEIDFGQSEKGISAGFTLSNLDAACWAVDLVPTEAWNARKTMSQDDEDECIRLIV